MGRPPRGDRRPRRCRRSASNGRSCAQRGITDRAARLEGAAGQQLTGARRLPLRSLSAARARSASMSGHGTQQRARVRMPRVADNSAEAERISTTRPAYITATRSAIPATSAEIVGDEAPGRDPALAHASQQLEDLRLHAHVERRRRFVRDQQLRRRHQRHRERHALPHAARTVRADTVAGAVAARASRPRRSASSARCARRARLGSAVRRSVPRRAESSMRRCGVSAFIGSCEHQADAARRAPRCSSRLGHARASPGPRTAPSRRASIGGEQPQAGEERLRLAGARFADDRQAFARRDVERDAVDAHCEPAALRREVDTQVADRAASGGLPVASRQRGLGSSASRRPSPRKLRHSSSVASTADGTSSCHGAFPSAARPPPPAARGS